MGDPESQKAKNVQLMEIMTQNGVLVGEVRVLDFFYYTKNKKSALELCDDLSTHGYKTEIDKRGFFRPTWTVTGQARVQATLEHLNAFCDQMWKFGALRGIEFDGWGTEL